MSETRKSHLLQNHSSFLPFLHFNLNAPPPMPKYCWGSSLKAHPTSKLVVAATSCASEFRRLTLRSFLLFPFHLFPSLSVDGWLSQREKEEDPVGEYLIKPEYVLLPPPNTHTHNHFPCFWAGRQRGREGVRASYLLGQQREAIQLGLPKREAVPSCRERRSLAEREKLYRDLTATVSYRLTSEEQEMPLV